MQFAAKFAYLNGNRRNSLNIFTQKLKMPSLSYEKETKVLTENSLIFLEEIQVW